MSTLCRVITIYYVLCSRSASAAICLWLARIATPVPHVATLAAHDTHTGKRPKTDPPSIYYRYKEVKISISHQVEVMAFKIV